ncbi:MAG: glutamate synthase large subunit, partial [Pseudomonadota bacterium]
MLEIRDLHAGYGQIEVLRGINLEVGAGEIVAVLGSNGVGKSTLNNNISALYKPFSGSIRFQGEDITGANSTEVVQRGLIHVPEGRRIFPNMNVRENLELGSQVRGKARRSQNLERVVEIFPRLKERFSQLAGTLSGGEQQMLAIGRGLMSEPVLLIMDEPSLGLSPLLVEQMFELISKINKEGMPILLMEQNAVQTLAIAHRAYIIENGVVAMQGTATEMARDPELRKNFKGTPEHVINFFYYVAEELRGIMAQLGFRTLAEMVGQTNKINSNKAISHYKAKGLDLSAILHTPDGYRERIVRNTEKQDHNLENVLDFQILKDSHRAMYRKEKMSLNYPINNTNRSVGAIVSNEISKIYGHLGLPEDTLNVNFTGSAGQSLGAFSAHGLTFTVEGNTNDYLGKGLSGAKLIIKKPAKATFVAEDNVIVGNVCLFGAVEGEAYINGIAGERFAVRNSGATAVVEGVGDHGCEYMTGGKV